MGRACCNQIWRASFVFKELDDLSDVLYEKLKNLIKREVSVSAKLIGAIITHLILRLNLENVIVISKAVQ